MQLAMRRVTQAEKMADVTYWRLSFAIEFNAEK
jgi:hypothetical protein